MTHGHPVCGKPTLAAIPAKAGTQARNARGHDVVHRQRACVEEPLPMRISRGASS